MIQLLANRFQKHIAWCLVFIFYAEIVVAAGTLKRTAVTSYMPNLPYSKRLQSLYPIDAENKGIGVKAAISDMPPQEYGGPTQPEMQSFTSVSSSNMVDPFSGDFSYNIPLLDVGGYPVNIAYRGGVTMDQEASWVGLGWNINPGNISRNMRGLPDDFNGTADSVRKTASVKDNKTVGVTAGANVELVGYSKDKKGNKTDTVNMSVNLGASLGVFHNTYKGWGMETGLNVSLNAGAGGKGPLTTGLSLNNNSQDGFSITPSLSLQLAGKDADEKSGSVGSFSVAAPYSSRTGLKSLQLSAGIRSYWMNDKNQKRSGGTNFSSSISFASPSFTPTINLPYTSSQFSFTGKVGLLTKTFHPSFFVSGYVSKQGIAAEDTTMLLPAYGYLNFQNGSGNSSSLLDFNREKDMPYREKPATPNIAVPIYTYDVFSITGEGTGGMFRAYRGDIGFVHDHFMRTKDNSTTLSVDIGFGDIVHPGIDANVSRSVTESMPWTDENIMRKTVAFQKDSGLFEAAYFRNPNEKSINSKDFYNAVGGDDVVAVGISQRSASSPSIVATNNLVRYKDMKFKDKITLQPTEAVKKQRDKRSQSISYLNAKEAAIVGLSKYIEYHPVNNFRLKNCNTDYNEDEYGDGNGFRAEYFANKDLAGNIGQVKIDTAIYFPKDPVSGDTVNTWTTNKKGPKIAGTQKDNRFSIRWVGRFKAPVTGSYRFQTKTDDGVRLWINEKNLINDWRTHSEKENIGRKPGDTLNLVAGELYNIRMEFFEKKKKASVHLRWSIKGGPFEEIPSKYIYSRVLQDTFTQGSVVKEKRINSFRKENHISEINVLNADGRKYVYGIPVYNLKQKEVTFSVDKGRKDTSGLVDYNWGDNNSTHNLLGRDRYFSSEEVSAYAHTYLLTGIVSPDYVDITGDGISDDDIGDAVKFNYTKTAGIGNPFQWRLPYQSGPKANYSEGLKTDDRDDKGSYVYGKKEMWYLNTIESKNMVAAFFLDNSTRYDAVEINEGGGKTTTTKTKRLRKISLYNKAEFLLKDTMARPVKTVYFEYTYELCKGFNKPANDSGKLTLKKIWFSYNGNEKGRQNPYVFSYHANNPNYNTKYFDRWGNYKPDVQNPSSSGVISNADHPYSLQDSVAAAYNVAAWTLNTIKLPSGGVIKVDYESDDYAYVQNKRAMQMTKINGFSSVIPSIAVSNTDEMYSSGGDKLYTYFNIPSTITTSAEFQKRYLEGVKKVYFKLFVNVPADKFGSGSEYISCYADVDTFGVSVVFGQRVGWVKLKAVDKKGMLGGSYSPLVKAATQFLRLNLPSKGYPGSDSGDDLDLSDAINMVLTQATNIIDMVSSFDNKCRTLGWMKKVDLNRSLLRMNCPTFKKYGGGARVKRVTVYDNWNAMTGGKEATYGQEYSYTTTKDVNGVPTTISSGVASYEPGLGGEENPFRQPIEYIERVSLLGPTTQGYTEEPLGESFFPSASVGYSKMRVRSIHAEPKRRSANGYEETCFFTTYDYPTLVDRSLIDQDTKKRFKPSLTNFLKINIRHYVAVSQGFKVELNDMNGKVRSQASYPQTDPENYISYTEYFYKSEQLTSDTRKLTNTVTTMSPDGAVDTTSLIGKDVELMMDMREQKSVVNGASAQVNVDVTSFAVPPVIAIPSFYFMPQRDETKFRSIATTKIVQHYGIIDSVISVDKGSKVSTKNLLYDSETGDVLLTRTQNEFNDPIYNFSYPSHWGYDGMGMAFKNIGATLSGLNIRNGKISDSSLPIGTPLDRYFASGDEILAYTKIKTGGPECKPDIASYPTATKIWAIDTNSLHGGNKVFYFIDKDGMAFTGNDVTLKVVRSGRRNMASGIGSVTTMRNPLVYNISTSKYELKLDSGSKVLNASVVKYKQLWKTGDRKKLGRYINCSSVNGGNCACLSKFFKYLIEQHKLFTKQSGDTTVGTLIAHANSLGYAIDSCDILTKNANRFFYATTTDSIATSYTARIGDCSVTINPNAGPINFYQLQPFACTGSSTLYFKGLRTTSKRIPASYSMILFNACDSNSMGPGGYMDPELSRVDTSKSIVSEYKLKINTGDPGNRRYAETIFRFDGLSSIPSSASIQSANLRLVANVSGHLGIKTHAHSYDTTTTVYSAFDLFYNKSTAWNISSPSDTIHFMNSADHIEKYSPFQNSMSINASPFVSGFLAGTYRSKSILMRERGGYQEWCSIATRQQGPGPLVDHSKFTLFYPTDEFTTFYSERYSDTTKIPVISVTYTNLDTLAQLQVNACTHCDTTFGCYSAITDTVVNPYVYGILGNYRPDTSYVYYGQRSEANPWDTSDIRTNGSFKEFLPFWKFDGSKLKAYPDTTKWVWNSTVTMFSPKGFELENKDPLGRYNSMQYGYNATLPTAVVQNSRYGDAAFEGFEDYSYGSNSCDTACSSPRYFDFSSLSSFITSSYSHTGKYSLRIPGTLSKGVPAKTSIGSVSEPALRFNSMPSGCGWNVLKSLKSDSSSLLPIFSPMPGKKFVMSAWVRVEKDCKCETYVGYNEINIYVGSTNFQFVPKGNIIDGWQRYEGVFDVPSSVGLANISISFRSSTANAVYFDDIRIHPFNANMKSFVYHDVNLRLMAELDENNYATFYEYDDDGTLVRVKKETERGIKTIKETRSALRKED